MSYPIRVIEPGDKFRVPVVIAMGGPVAIEMTLRGRVARADYSGVRSLSVH